MNFGERKIQVTDLPELDNFDKAKIETGLSHAFDKMQKISGKEVLLRAHFKQHEEKGKSLKIKHSVHLKLDIPGKTVVATDSGWNPVDVVQSAIKSLEREAMKALGKN